MSRLGRRIRRHPLAALIGAVALLALAVGSASAAVRSPHELSLPYQLDAVLSAESRENTSVLVQNNSPKSTTIVMEFHTPGGVLIPLASEIHPDVPAWSTRTFEQKLNTGLLPGFRGVGVLSSDRALNALLLREVSGPSGTVSYSIHSGQAAAMNRVALPYVANRLWEGYEREVLNTRFSIANAGLNVACVTVTFELVAGRGVTPVGGGGAVVSPPPSESETCPAGAHEVPVAGQLTLTPTGGDGSLAMPAGTRFRLASVLIESTQPVTVAADIYRGVLGNGQLGSYDGFTVGGEESDQDDIAREVIIPVAQKAVDGYWTELAITNPWDEAVTGSIVYRGSATGGREVEVTVDITVPARGGFTHSLYHSDAVPEGFSGWALVKADRPVAALLLRGEAVNSGHAYAAVNGTPGDRTATSAKFPLVFRNAYTGGVATGSNSWMGVAVADGGTATLRVIAVNTPTEDSPDGCDTLRLFRTTITISGSFFFNQGSDETHVTGLGELPECMAGGMAITSDKPIAAIGGVTSDVAAGDTDGMYNAFH